MFKFLKEKLKSAVSAFSSKVEGDEPKEEPDEKKGFFRRLKDRVAGEAEPEKRPAPVDQDPEGESQSSIAADEFEKIIKDVDIHAPAGGEAEPEPVPSIEDDEEEEQPVLVVPPPELEDKPRRAPESERSAAVEVIKYDHKVQRIKPDGEIESAEPERRPKEGGDMPEPKVAPKVEPGVEQQKQRVRFAPETKTVRPVVKSEPKIVTTPIPTSSPVESTKLAETLDLKKPAEGFFGKLAQAVTSKRITGAEFENLFWDLEVVLMESNVAVEVIEKLKTDMKKVVVDAPLPRGKVEDTILEALRQSLREVMSAPSINLLEKVKEKRPFVIAFVGVNGSGKTTTIAKVAYLLQQHKLSVVLAAGDTFRAAAIDQLELHGKRLGVKVVKHEYGADPAAVAFDAIKHAQAKDIDVVLIDTAGRLHSNVNLVDEMKKIIRVAKPDMKLFIGESITGNDCIEQAQQFDNAVGIDGIILSKADVDEKGGTAVSVSYVTKKPILYLGMGQEYADLVPFDPQQLLESLGL